jgi:hypothetical protein
MKSILAWARTFPPKGLKERTPHIEWLRPEHLFTAISPKSEVHANHNEAQNSSLRRRASADHRRQNHYAKIVEGLQRALNVQRLIPNWVRPHWELEKTRHQPWQWAISSNRLQCSNSYFPEGLSTSPLSRSVPNEHLSPYSKLLCSEI